MDRAVRRDDEAKHHQIGIDGAPDKFAAARAWIDCHEAYQDLVDHGLLAQLGS